MSIETVSRDPVINGAGEFRHFTTANFSLLLSQSGETLLRENPNVVRLLRQYRQDFEQRRDHPGEVRMKLQEGNEGIIYTMKPDDEAIIVKEYGVPFTQTSMEMPIERQTAFLQDTLARAERLRLFCDDYAPEFIKVPKHYGLLSLPDGDVNMRECLLFMERVNGISMDQFLTSTDYDHALKVSVQKDWHEEVKTLFEWDSPRTDPEFSNQKLASDLFPRNIMVDTSSPNRKRPYTLWIIDQ